MRDIDESLRELVRLTNEIAKQAELLANRVRQIQYSVETIDFRLRDIYRVAPTETH